MTVYKVTIGHRSFYIDSDLWSRMKTVGMYYLFWLQFDDWDFIEKVSL